MSVDKLRLLIFDWDGTLANSTERIVESLSLTCQKLNVTAPSRADIVGQIGIPAKQAINTLFAYLSSEQKTVILDMFLNTYRSVTENVDLLYPGVKNLLNALANEGYYLSIATSKRRQALNREIDAAKINHLFKYTCCADEAKSKPHPEMIYRTLGYFNVNIDEALMIGDSHHDIKMANNANINGLVVFNGLRTKEDFLDYKSRDFLNNINDLKEWLTVNDQKFF